MLVGIKQLTEHPMAKIYYDLNHKDGESFSDYIERVDSENRAINRQYRCYDENGEWVGF